MSRTITGVVSASDSSDLLVVVQAQKGKWQEKREAYRAKESKAFMSRHADRMADRQAET